VLFYSSLYKHRRDVVNIVILMCALSMYAPTSRVNATFVIKGAHKNVLKQMYFIVNDEIGNSIEMSQELVQCGGFEK
jgi:hypothetical protein